MNTIKTMVALSAFLAPLIFSNAQAAAVDLSTWTAESYPAVSGFGDGVWTVSDDMDVGDNGKVVQSVNGQPTFFYSDFDTFGSKFTSNIKVTGSDDDYIGFALGFNPGDATNPAADYLLIDWKRGNQTFNFGAPSDTPGSTAFSGLSVSRVTGIPTADEFWGHVDFDDASSQLGDGLVELQRGATLGNTGWVINDTNEFTFDFGPTDLEVFVNGTLELDIAGLFNNGRFAFYNFSQAGVTYAGLEKETGSFPPVPAIPVPAAVWLFGTALIGLVGFSKRRKTA